MILAFSTVWNFGDYLSANQLSNSLQRKRQWLIALAAIIAGVAISNPIHSELASFGLAIAFGLPIIIGLLACLVGFRLADKVVLPRRARRAYEQLLLDGVVTQFDFDDTGIRITSPLGASNLTWDHVTKWAEDKNLILLFRTQVMFFAVPKTQVASETLDALRGALIAADVSRA